MHRRRSSRSGHCGGISIAAGAIHACTKAIQAYNTCNAGKGSCGDAVAETLLSVASFPPGGKLIKGAATGIKALGGAGRAAKAVEEFVDNTAVPKKLTDSKLIELPVAVAVSFAVRTKIETVEGIWLRVSGGEHENWWVKEEAGRAFPRLCLDKHHYARPRRLIFGPGTVSHHRFNQWASPIDVQQLEVASPAVMTVKSKALWNGVWYYELLDVPGSSVQGRWVRCDAV